MLVSQGIIIKYLSGRGEGGGRGGGGGGGGGELTYTPKSTGVQLGQHGTGCSTRTLASAGSNWSDTTKNLKWPEKKKPNFYSPPPPPTHTYLHRRNTQRIGIWKMLPIRGNHPHHPKQQNLPPYPPTKIYQTPLRPTPSPLCVHCHNIDSSGQWRVQGNSGGSLWAKIISFSWRIFRKTIR